MRHPTPRSPRQPPREFGGGPRHRRGAPGGWLVALAIALGAPGGAAAQAQGDTLPPLAHQIARMLHIDEADKQKLRAGEIVSAKLAEEHEKELHLGVAMLLPASAKRIYARIASGEVLEVDQTVLAAGEIPRGEAPLGALADLALPASELAKLREVEPGSTFNLAGGEIAALREVAGQDAALQAAFRQLLAARVQAFAKRGLDGIAPYDRGGGESVDPAKELRHALSAYRLLPQEAPEFFGALGEPPGRSQGMEEQLYWRLQQIQDRPTAILERRLFREDLEGERGYALMASQRFYVSQSFNSLQILAGVFQLGDRALVFYSNQTFTDQVAGFGSSAAHAIGRKFMLSEIVKLFESIRESELARDR